MSRLEANRQIIQMLSAIVESCPDWRFQQILQNVGVSSRFGEDRWYEESEETLQKIKNSTSGNSLEV